MSLSLFRFARVTGLRALAIVLLVGMSFAALFGGVSAQEGSVNVTLNEEEGSGVTGTAVLTADGNQTTVEVTLENAEEGWEGHAFDSTCDDHQGATTFYAIEAIDANGQSTSTWDVPLEDVATGDFYLHMHKPGGEFGIGVACGNIPALSSAAGGALPASGVGFGVDHGTGSWLTAGIAALAFMFFGVARRLGAATVLRR